MCSIMNGIAAHGIFRPSGATFLVFADYCRAGDPPRRAQPPAGHLRLHARQRRRRRGRPDARARRDHPRPARHPEPRRDPPGRSGGDGRRVRRRARAHRRPDAARAHAPGRAAADARFRCKTRREGVLKGGYIAKKETGAARAHSALGGQRAAARARRPPRRSARARASSACRASRASIASPPPTAKRCCRESCRKRVAIEATVTSTWAQYVGLDGAIVGIDRFGMSAPGAHGHEGARHDRRARGQRGQGARRQVAHEAATTQLPSRVAPALQLHAALASRRRGAMVCRVLSGAVSFLALGALVAQATPSGGAPHATPGGNRRSAASRVVARTFPAMGTEVTFSAYTSESRQGRAGLRGGLRRDPAGRGPDDRLGAAGASRTATSSASTRPPGRRR